MLSDTLLTTIVEPIWDECIKDNMHKDKQLFCLHTLVHAPMSLFLIQGLKNPKVKVGLIQGNFFHGFLTVCL